MSSAGGDIRGTYVGTVSSRKEEQETQVYIAISTSEVGRVKEVKAEFSSKGRLVVATS